MDRRPGFTASCSVSLIDLRFAHKYFEEDTSTSSGWACKGLDQFFSAILVSSTLMKKDFGRFEFINPRKICAI